MRRAYHGSFAADQAAAAYEAAVRHFGNAALIEHGLVRCKLTDVDRSLKGLRALSPLLKRPLLEACADAVLHDGEVTLAESELLRAVSETLDCPMPPLAPN